VRVEAELALLCDVHGAVVEVLRNPPELGLRVEVGMLFARLASKGSLSKALAFVAEVQANGVAVDHEINLSAGDHVKTLRFVGGKMGQQLLIVGSQADEAARRLYAEIMRISNEQSNQLRATLVTGSHDDRLYDEISRLNNELVAIQREVAKQNAELKRLNQEKNRFLGMAAHDLRNPLHTLLVHSEFLLGQCQDPQQRQFLQVIASTSDYMARLVDDLLDVSRIESGQLVLDYAPVELAGWITRVVDLNRPFAARKQIEITCRLEDHPPVALLDGQKLEQVLNNLIGNALKFSEPGTRVEVRLWSEAEVLFLSVHDHGPGISQEQMRQLFKPFQRGRKGSAGELSTGLGLVIVKRIIEGHGGRLSIDSEVGRGTVFTCALPSMPPQAGGR
jgi:two-component system, OmpR family, sensor kinase